MPDSLSPQKQPDLFSPETQKRILEILHNPFSIAILASTGLHGLAFIVLPMLPSAKPAEIDPKQTVGVVELSPIEQLRLPDFANPQVTFPPASSQKQSQTFSKSSSKKSSTSSLFDNSSFYNFPLLSPPPPITILPNLDLPPILDDRPQQRKRNPEKKPENPPESKRNTPSDKPEPPPAKEEPKEDTPADLIRPEELTQEQKMALLEEARKSLKKRQLFAFNAANTTREDYDKNLTAFQDLAVKASSGNIEADWKGKKLITDQFPLEACPFVKETRFASVGAIVKPDGQFEKEPELLLSSGYGILNDAAKDYFTKQVKEHMKPSDKYQGFVYNFEFDPKSVCPAGDSQTPT
ncbi:hypothetical protein [Leptothermofonsia sp. ETS-13]|uniref:hypothetical protein n=1 Tax=Leptothermofonsia sp. ETS-13 TaxID=3035696 RepID=UPI003BA204B2